MSPEKVPCCQWHLPTAIASKQETLWTSMCCCEEDDQQVFTTVVDNSWVGIQDISLQSTRSKRVVNGTGVVVNVALFPASDRYVQGTWHSSDIPDVNTDERWP